MKSKKLIFLTLVALSFMSTAVNAWRDYDDGYHPVGDTGEEIAAGTEEMGEGNIVGGAGRVVTAPVVGIFGGSERRRERREEREQRRLEREEGY